MKIVKSRSVLHRVGLDDGEYVTFGRVIDEPDEPGRYLRIDVGMFHDMGDPDVVTITIEPGDHLNEET